MNKVKNKKSKINEKIGTDKKTEIIIIPKTVCKKKITKRKKKEELPSFLLNLPPKPEEISVPHQDKHYLGPLFFGGCQQQHPPFHNLTLGSAHAVTHPVVSVEDLLKNLFLPKPAETKKQPEKPFRPHVKQHRVFDDPYPHKCPGVRKAFVPEVFPRVVDLGETDSPTEGETSREIPFYRIKTSYWSSETELEIVTLSDLREMKRMYMSEKERAAHSHFPKEFVTVRVIGPRIPESITFKKLPTKRKRLSDLQTPLSSQIQIIREVQNEENPIVEEQHETSEELEDDESKFSVEDTENLVEKMRDSLSEQSGLLENFEGDNEETEVIEKDWEYREMSIVDEEVTEEEQEEEENEF